VRAGRVAGSHLEDIEEADASFDTRLEVPAVALIGSATRA
jgi:hypothetical protein